MALSEHVAEVALLAPLNGTGARLFVGSLVAAESEEFHSANGITHVLTAAGRLIPSERSGCPAAGSGPAALPSSVRHAHLVLKRLADHPTANILEQLEAALRFCHDALETGGGLLVHCASGVSRSVAVIVALLITRCGLSYEDALRHVRATRPNAAPNLGFEQQLLLLASNGGDLAKACALWSLSSSEDVMLHAKRQRDAANAMHVKIDEIENEYRAAQSAGTIDTVTVRTFQQRLDATQDEIDTFMGEIEDRVARSILKAAAQKTSRFLSEVGT
jgi:hypothetical protein